LHGRDARVTQILHPCPLPEYREREEVLLLRSVSQPAEERLGLIDKLFPPPDRDKFAKLFVAELRRGGVTGEVEYDPASFKLVLSDEKCPRRTIFLSNSYNEYVAAPRSARAAVLERFARLPAQMEEGAEMAWEQAKAILLPRVRERFYHETLRLVFLRENMPDTDRFVTQSLNDHLTVELALDLADSIKTVSARTLEGWKVSFDDALAVARDNLWKRSNENFVPLAPGLYRSAWQDNHDASRLFLHDLVWQLEVKGSHVAMVPNRDLLLVCGDGDPEALATLATLADGILQENRPMTGVAFRLEGKNWLPFLPPADSPAYRAVKQAAVRSRAMEYAEQAKLLESLHEKTGRDVYVPSHNVMQREDGSLFSFTSWVEDVTDALMPEADLVTFGRVVKGKAHNYGLATWDRVRRVLSGLMEPTEHYPPRYRVRAFPTKEQLAQLELKQKP
jgi:hypothetical protein